MAMDTKPNRVVVLILGVLLLVGLVAVILYARQRLFTRTEPIVLTS